MDKRALAALLRLLRAHGVTSYSAGEEGGRRIDVMLDREFRYPAKPGAIPADIVDDVARDAQAQLLSDLFAHEGS